MFHVVIDNQQSINSPLVINESISHIIESLDSQLYLCNLNYKNNIRAIKTLISNLQNVNESIVPFEYDSITENNTIDYLTNIVELVIDSTITNLSKNVNYHTDILKLKTTTDLLNLYQEDVIILNSLFYELDSLLPIYSKVTNTKVNKSAIYDIFNFRLQSAVKINESKIASFKSIPQNKLETQISESVFGNLNSYMGDDLIQTYNNIKNYAAFEAQSQKLELLQLINPIVNLMLVDEANNSKVGAAALGVFAGIGVGIVGTFSAIRYIINGDKSKLSADVIGEISKRIDAAAGNKDIGLALINKSKNLTITPDFSDRLMTTVKKLAVDGERDMISLLAINWINDSLNENSELTTLLNNQAGPKIEIIEKAVSGASLRELKPFLDDLGITTFWAGKGGTIGIVTLGAVLLLTSWIFWMFKASESKMADEMKKLKRFVSLYSFINKTAKKSAISKNLIIDFKNIDSAIPRECRFKWSITIGRMPQCAGAFIIAAYAIFLNNLLVLFKSEGVDMNSITSPESIMNYKSTFSFKLKSAIDEYTTVHRKILDFHPDYIPMINKTFTIVRNEFLNRSSTTTILTKLPI